MFALSLAPGGTVAPGDGWLLRLDPRLRVVAAIGFACVVAGLSSLAALCLALAFALGLLALSGLPTRPLLRKMAAMDGFIVFMLVLLPFSTPGQPLGSLWEVSFSREGVVLALDIALSANAAILVALVLLGSLQPVVLGHALARLRVPMALVQLMLFTLRYIEVVEAEYARMRQAMKARGFRPASNLHTLRSFGHLIGMMLVRAHDRSERILRAMKCRGFTGQFPCIDTMGWQRGDLWAGLGLALVLAALMAVEMASRWADVAVA